MSSVSFSVEPGEYRWIFEKLPDQLGGIRIRIWSFEELWAYLPVTQGKEMLNGVVDCKLFYHTMLRMFSDVLADYGEDGYKEIWNGDEMPFPIAVYKELVRLTEDWPGLE